MQLGNRVYVDFLGCKLNQAEVEQISLDLTGKGFVLSKNIGQSDYYILNSCAVTSEAESKSRAKLARAKRQNPQIIRVLIGCCGQKDREKYFQNGLVEYVFGNLDKYDFFAVLPPSPPSHLGLPQAFLGRKRSFVQIQEGCDNFCSFCIVPLLRGKPVSFPLSQIVATVKNRFKLGYLEVTLTGTEIGAYREGEGDLVSLIQAILTHTEIPRLRLSSLQPTEITDSLLRLFKDSPRLCPHFHIPLQSASNVILKKMNRMYTIEQYSAALNRIWQWLPQAAVTTDIIVGFPTETNEEFQKTLDFCRSTSFSRLHVFAYNKRPGTKASLLDGQINDKYKKERMAEFLELAVQKQSNFAQKHLGATVSVYVEGSRNGLYEGYAPDYLRVCFPARRDVSGQIINVRVDSLASQGQFVWGSENF